MKKIELICNRLKTLTKDFTIAGKVAILVDDLQEEYKKQMKEVAKSCKKTTKSK